MRSEYRVLRAGFPFMGLAGAMALLLGGCEFSPDYGPAGGGKVDFVSEVKPVLELHCLECHNRKYAAKMGGLRLETRKLAMTTGTHGPVIVPGDVRSSLLYKNLRLSHATPTAMPPKPDKLKRGEKQIIARWIREGAHWPEGAQGRLSPPPEEKEKPKEPEKSEKKEKKKEDPAVTPDPRPRAPRGDALTMEAPASGRHKPQLRPVYQSESRRNPSSLRSVA